MDLENPSLKDVAKEVATPGYLDRARVRSRASKTVWDLLFMPIGYAIIAAYWYIFSTSALWLHDLSHAGAPLDRNMSLAQGLILLGPAFAALPLGFMSSNVLQGLLPAARRAHEAKSQQPGWVSIRGAQRGLFRLALILVPLGLGAAVIGALI